MLASLISNFCEEDDEDEEEDTCCCMPLYAVYVVGCCVCVLAIENIFVDVIQLSKPLVGS